MAILRYSIFFFLSQKKIFSSFIFGFLNWLLLFDCLVLLPYTFFFFSCQHLMYNINKIIDVWLVVQRESSWFFLFKCKERKKSKSRSPSMCVCVCDQDRDQGAGDHLRIQTTSTTTTNKYNSLSIFFHRHLLARSQSGHHQKCIWNKIK